MLAIEWRRVSVARCGTLRHLSPRSRTSHKVATPTAAPAGTYTSATTSIWVKVRQALNEDSPPFLLLWDVHQRTRVIGVCCRVEDLDAGVVVAGKCRCGTRTAGLHRIVRRVEPNPEVINLHGAISYRARL